jgi:hypothetical protein
VRAQDAAQRERGGGPTGGAARARPCGYLPHSKWTDGREDLIFIMKKLMMETFKLSLSLSIPPPPSF